ncbi:DUF2231 domain-containing protein [Luteimonas yindakuii]|uniref:DUF2231 domain-containing protein n=2 Tax=Luteimonas yindakuii TaxID=2565782 RepID=A0A4Z1RFJ5_9GAMM|nr:DUF2231 domain-containing protein [Luteimonas yindakuii]QCO68824.1 DUF2231 domain-containing protein [Luteimonas yindakuii]TKS54943.1 DUF2231 domain-containing protein [Luteimonas yindakuii]
MRKTLEQPKPRTTTHSVRSRVAIAKHPLHPMLVVYPVALLSLVFPADLLSLWFDTVFWSQTAFWMNAVGLAIGVVAGIAGTADMFLIRVVRRHVSAWNHFIVAVMVLAMAGLGVWLRAPDPAAAVWPWGLLQSGVLLLLVMIAGWLGGTLSFRHGIGVYGEGNPHEHEADDKPPAE